jgi:hypothetical protein
VFLCLFLTINAQSKIELWGKFLQNGWHAKDWLYDNYDCLFLHDSILYTSLLQPEFMSQINMKNKHITNKSIHIPTFKQKGITYPSGSFIPYKDGFLSSYSYFIYFFNPNGKRLFYQAVDGETIEQILLTKSGNIILYCLNVESSRLILMDKNGNILDQLPLNLSYIPSFSWWYNGDDELLTDLFNVKIEDNKLVKLKEKRSTFLEKFYEYVVGYNRNYFFLCSKTVPNKLIIRNSETLSPIGEIILPEEMVKLIKKTRTYKEMQDPTMRVVSLNNNQHFIIFSCNGFLYIYSMTTNW